MYGKVKTIDRDLKIYAYLMHLNMTTASAIKSVHLQMTYTHAHVYIALG